MADALAALALVPEYALIDAFTLPEVSIPHHGIIDGDALCLSIAAASIVAKVHRDHIMTMYDALYPHYGFAHHKGYSTAEHLDALVRHGPCPIHRRSFAPVRDCIVGGA
jgi:ribonuclease HII